MKGITIILVALAALAAPAAAQAATKHYDTTIALHPVAWHGCTQGPQPSTDSWIVRCGGGRGGYVTYAHTFPRNATSRGMSTYWATHLGRTSWGRSWGGRTWYQNIHVAAFSTVRLVRIQWEWITP